MTPAGRGNCWKYISVCAPSEYIYVAGVAMRVTSDALILSCCTDADLLSTTVGLEAAAWPAVDGRPSARILMSINTWIS